MIVNAYTGEAIHHLESGRVRRFTPQGEVSHVRKGRVLTAEEAAANPIKRIETGSQSARIFVGLSVGDKKTYTVKDVVDAVYKAYKTGASFLVQKGIYQDERGKRVTEDSVQIIIIDFAGLSKEAFTARMKKLSETLRAKFRQQLVVLEIQQRGVVTDVFSVTP